VLAEASVTEEIKLRLVEYDRSVSGLSSKIRRRW